MIPIRVASLSSKGLQRGDFLEELPEYYALRQVGENGPWHLHQNCFDHVVKVFAAYEQISSFEFLSPPQKEKVDGYLNQQIDSHTRRELLTLTVLLHDIAKTETQITHVDGTENCPGHELIGAMMMKDFSARFELTPKEADQLERMVRYHGFVSDIVDRIAKTGKVEYETELFERTVGDIALELMIFILADLRGCDLDQSTPDLFHTYEKIEIDFIQKRAQEL